MSPRLVLDILKRAAAISDPGYGVWAYETWVSHNALYFNGELRPCPIQWGLTPHGHSLGYFSPDLVRITLHTSLVVPRSDAWHMRDLLGPKIASDVLLHEMIHQYVYQVNGHDGGGTSCHNNDCWAAEVNRIAAILGLPSNARMVKQRRVDGSKPRWLPVDGCMSLTELSRWPYLSRPDGYYEAAAAEQLVTLLGGHHG
jgi:hypothetical protein